MKQKKTLQEQLAAITKAKNAQDATVLQQEEALMKKDREIADIIKKASEAAAEAQEAISRKDQQIWSMNNQLADETLKSEQQRAAASAANKKREEAAALRSTVDESLITDIEKKWQSNNQCNYRKRKGIFGRD